MNELTKQSLMDLGILPSGLVLEEEAQALEDALKDENVDVIEKAETHFSPAMRAFPDTEMPHYLGERLITARDGAVKLHAMEIDRTDNSELYQKTRAEVLRCLAEVLHYACMGDLLIPAEMVEEGEDFEPPAMPNLTSIPMFKDESDVNFYKSPRVFGVGLEDHIDGLVFPSPDSPDPAKSFPYLFPKLFPKGKGGENAGHTLAEGIIKSVDEQMPLWMQTEGYTSEMFRADLESGTLNPSLSVIRRGMCSSVIAASDLIPERKREKLNAVKPKMYAIRFADVPQKLAQYEQNKEK